MVAIFALTCKTEQQHSRENLFTYGSRDTSRENAFAVVYFNKYSYYEWR